MTAKLDGTHAGQRIVDFLNTAYLPERDDVLGDGRAAGWLTDWLGGAPVASTRSEDEAPLRQLRDLREGLRQFAAANNGQPPDEEAIGRAAAALGSVELVLDLGGHDRVPQLLAAAPVATPSERTLVAVAGCFLTARITQHWARVKACAAPDCRYAYFDTSRNRSRRWCEMAYCGNRAKNRAWRERQNTTPEAVPRGR